mmetsp:Transcript_15423/g.21171  ORF Transcript_15423/g.21171 Transcript_15423/m.21171 type:complete len:100 (+) Transcript_15423:111-410(+)
MDNAMAISACVTKAGQLHQIHTVLMRYTHHLIALLETVLQVLLGLIFRISKISPIEWQSVLIVEYVIEKLENVVVLKILKVQLANGPNAQMIAPGMVDA